MSYTARLRIEVPASLYDTACAIARALDPDVAGHLSYGPREQGDPPAIPETYSTETPCTPAFAEQAIAMMADPAMLHAVVAADYAARWVDLKAPTLTQCKTFCAKAVVTDATAQPAAEPPPAEPAPAEPPTP